MAEITHKHFTGPKYEHDSKFGHSWFSLRTRAKEMDPDSGKEVTKDIVLNGLLTELPEMSFSINYEDGPGNEWQDILSKFMANDLVSIFNVIGAEGGGFKSLLKSGTWTKQMYTGYNPSTIPLKLRLYDEDLLGQSPITAWKEYLSKYASISSDSEFSMLQAGKNVLNAFVNAYRTGEAAAEKTQEIYFKGKQTFGEDDKKGTEEYQKRQKDIIFKVTKINEYLRSNIANFLKANELNDFRIRCYIALINANSLYQPGKIVFRMSTEKGDENDWFADSWEEAGKWDDPDKDPNELKIEVEDITEKLKEGLQKRDELRSYVDSYFSENFIQGIKDIVNSTSGPSNEEATIDKAFKFFESVGNAVEATVFGKFGPGRVYGDMNVENALGEKLWYLYIYTNVFFNADKPLTVYISDWSIKPSEETIYGKPVYYDLEITCALDQIYSRDRWKDSIFVY